MNANAAPFHTNDMLLPLLMTELSVRGGSVAAWRVHLARWQFTARRRHDFYSKLHVEMSDGKSLPVALTHLWHAQMRRPVGRLHPISVAVPIWLGMMLGDGHSTHDALATWLPPNERVYLGARETRHGLDGYTFYKLGQLAQMEARSRSNLRSLALSFVASSLIVLTTGYLGAIAHVTFAPNSAFQDGVPGPLSVAREATKAALKELR